MNRLQALLDREQGISNSLDYDFMFARLRVHKTDSWRGIVPSFFNSDFNPEPPIFSAKFANCNGYRHMLAMSNEDGKIALQDVTKRNEQPTERPLFAPQCHHNAVFDVEWAPGHMKFVSASGDHTARLWDVDGAEIREVRSFLGHTRSVKTAAFKRNDPTVFATGGRDGAIIIWDTRANLNIDLTPRADNCIFSGHCGYVAPGTPLSQRKRARSSKLPQTAAASSITGLAFQDSNTLISCGAGDGVIKVWDLRRNYMVFKKEPQPKHSLPYAGTSTFKGFTNLIVDASGSRLYANCMDNTIYCYNLCSYAAQPLERYKGLLNSTFYIKACLSPDNKYLISGSSDEKAFIWNLKYADEPLVALEGHNVEVTCVAWGATHDCPIVTCSDDARHKIWRIGNDDDKVSAGEEQHCGKAVVVRSLKPANKRKNSSYLDLVSTPRTLKRLEKLNERTPETTKRIFADILAENTATEEPCEEQDMKRPRLLESRGRRLFSATSTNHSCCSVSSNNTSPRKRALNVALSSLPSSSSPEESPTNCTCSVDMTPPKDENSPPIYGKKACIESGEPLVRMYSDSPTSNLPNYVLDGEAPHISVMSPKRKIKQTVDWLTKIRKQKLSNPRNGMLTLADKLNGVETANKDEVVGDCKAHLQVLHVSEDSPRLIATPRRRNSQDGRPNQPRTPTSSRQRICETNTLLRFFNKQCTQIREVDESTSLDNGTVALVSGSSVAAQ